MNRQAWHHQLELERRQQLEEEEQREEEEEKQQAIDLESYYAEYDENWWRELDHDLTQEELRQVEVLAEIQEYRTKGYM